MGGRQARSRRQFGVRPGAGLRRHRGGALPGDIESAIGLVLAEALAFDEALNMDGKMLRMLEGFGPTRSQQDDGDAQQAKRIVRMFRYIIRRRERAIDALRWLAIAARSRKRRRDDGDEDDGGLSSSSSDVSSGSGDDD